MNLRSKKQTVEGLWEVFVSFLHLEPLNDHRAALVRGNRPDLPLRPPPPHLCSCGNKKLDASRPPQPCSVNSPVACGGDEINAAVHPGVGDPLLPVDVDLLLQVGFILVIDELHNGQPAGRKQFI